MRILPLAALSLALASCASGRPIAINSVSDSARFEGATEITVTLSNFDFAPEPLVLTAGRPVALTLVNEASGGHDFTAPDFFEAATILASDAALVTEGEVDLEAGQSVTVHLIPAAGSYELVCTHLGHAALGMTGTITVR